MPAEEDPIVIVSYDVRWPEEFRGLAATLRRALGDRALRIDHVGSTAVPELDAKDVIDVQISVAGLDPWENFRVPLERIGYIFDASNDDRTQRFFREPLGHRRTHVHVRAAGSFDEQLNLLFRDFLRAHPVAARGYALEKRALAERHRDDREAYVRAKQPTVWRLLIEAHEWSQAVGWSPPSRDA
jgi:GrpB-like predicted nucleotidyltransferase (UPF0157 family)